MHVQKSSTSQRNITKICNVILGNCEKMVKMLKLGVSQELTKKLPAIDKLKKNLRLENGQNA